MFDPVDPKQSLPALEEGILQYWREEDTFKRSISQRREHPERVREKGDAAGETAFSFYDGPPFATGLPHYGHLLAGTIKDVIPRYWTMRGSAVERRFGWDCHGLPVENLVEQENSIKNKQEIEEKGVQWFNDLCRASVLRYTAEWRKTVERMGRWVDMDWDYRTMDPEYMESIWWAFSQLHRKGLITEGHKAMHICPRCATPLSNFEVTLGYRDREDMTTIATFPLVDDPKTVLLAWTTTTWSFPGDLWLGLGENIPYVKVKQNGDDRKYIVAKKLVADVFSDLEYEVIGAVNPHDLVGKKYQPLFDYFVDTVMPSTQRTHAPRTFGDAAFDIILHPEVAEEEGTGIVHFANANAEDGFLIAKDRGVDLLHYFGPDGKFFAEVRDFAGLDIKPPEGDPMATDKAIIAKLKEMGRWFKSFPYKHSYPHCWRCDQPLLNYVGSSWFVTVERIKEKMLQANAATEWVPAHVRDGRFGKWLEGARDWAISRSRFWGTPLPIWRTEGGEDPEVIGSRDDLFEHSLIRFAKVTALRHAESEGNLIPIYQGSLPGTSLTEKGAKEAKAVGKRYAVRGGSPGTGGENPVSVIYASPLARSRETAEIIAKETGAEVRVDDRLREVNFGTWEGKTVDFSDLTFVKERRAHKLAKEKPESIYHFEGMETWDSVQARLTAFMNDVLPRHRSEHIMIVTHADVMVNIKHFFTKEDPVKLSHQPYPPKAVPFTYFWDFDREAQLDLHKDTVDAVSWSGAASEKSIELHCVRHGETDWNVETRVQGSRGNPDLNKTGREQARALGKKLKGGKFDCIVASDLYRTIETAEILAEELGIPFAHKLAILNERDYGDWTGHTHKEIWEMAPPPLPMKNCAIHVATPANGESFSAYRKRIERGLEELLRQFPGKRVLFVANRGVIQVLRILCENLTYREALDASIGNTESCVVQVHPRVRRIPEVLDCWFESGSMPYAQSHYPFEYAHAGRAGALPPGFPADFIAEGMDQTRGWFYTLTVLGAALFGESPFRNCVVNGIVLAEDGKKMSKRLKNYPEPMEVVSKHGADAVRFTLMSSPAVRGEDLRFSEKLVEESVRNVLLPLWNTYSFFLTYANAAKFEPIETRHHSNHPLDTWIRAEVQDLCNRMTKELDNYDLSATCAELHETIDALTNWYVRLSRRRFAGRDGDEQRADALHTLYDVLLTLTQLLAPFCPFITDAIYLNLVPGKHGSVHLTDWPEARALSEGEHALLEKTRLMRRIVSLGNSVRAGQKVKVRQPLGKATIAAPIALSDEDRAILRQELNVKGIDFAANPEELAEVYIQVDARRAGPRLGARVQEIIAAGKAGEFTIQDDGTILILDEILAPDEAAIAYRGKEGSHVAADRGVVVSMDTEISGELRTEGIARDIIRGVQRLRKEEGLAFTDRIALMIEGADDVLAAHSGMIAEETRAELRECSGNEHALDLEGLAVTVRFTKM